MKFSGKCPVCGEALHLTRLACPACKAEFPCDEALSPCDCLPAEQAQFLQTFLACRGNMKRVQETLGISYPTASRRLDELLSSLGLDCHEEKEEEPDMSLFPIHSTDSVKASDLIRNKLYENGGKATVHSLNGKA